MFAAEDGDLVFNRLSRFSLGVGLFRGISDEECHLTGDSGGDVES